MLIASGVSKKGLTMDYEELAIELLRVQAKTNRLRASQQMDEYTQGEIFALSYLHESGKKAYPKDISKAMGVSTARVAVLLNHMEQKGWIRRLADEKDNRKTLVTMTDLGEEVMQQRRREVLDTVISVLKDLGEEDAQNLLRIQKKMLHEE